MLFTGAFQIPIYYFIPLMQPSQFKFIRIKLFVLEVPKFIFQFMQLAIIQKLRGLQYWLIMFIDCL
jgi:hypothetical protein